MIKIVLEPFVVDALVNCLKKRNFLGAEKW